MRWFAFSWQNFWFSFLALVFEGVPFILLGLADFRNHRIVCSCSRYYGSFAQEAISGDFSQWASRGYFPGLRLRNRTDCSAHP